MTKGCTFEGHSNVRSDFVEYLTLEDLEEESFAGCLSLEMNGRERHPDIIWVRGIVFSRSSLKGTGVSYQSLSVP